MPLAEGLFIWHFLEDVLGWVTVLFGGGYVTVAIFWLCAVDGIRPQLTDVVGVAVSLMDMAIIVCLHRRKNPKR